MSVRRVVKSSIDWAKFGQHVPKNQTPQFMSFKAKSAGYAMKVTEFPEALPAIDWAVYEKTVNVPGMVAQFKKEYEALAVTYPKDSYSSAVDQEAKTTVAEIKEYVAGAEKSIADLKVEHAKWLALTPLSEMLLDEYWHLFPEEAIDTFTAPSMWPHTEEFQPEYLDKCWDEGKFDVERH